MPAIILVSAHDLSTVRRNYGTAQNPFDGYLAKPVSAAMLSRLASSINYKRHGQTARTAPTFMLAGNQLDALPDSYVRYLINSLRETFELPGTPIRVSLKSADNPYDKPR